MRHGLIRSIHAVLDPHPDRRTRIEKSLAHCRAEWENAHALAQQKGLQAQRALRMASVAYKLALPPLTSIQAIKAAIACIAQGVALEVFDGRDASQLLYSAQVALTVHNARGRKK